MSTYGLWLSAAGMKVQDHRQALLANNMANAETAGFKQDFAMVTQRRVESLAHPQGHMFRHAVLDVLPGGINVHPTYHSFAQGELEPTGRPLDTAIQGEGFFAVRDGEKVRYTRDGRFTLNRDGELVLSAGDGRWKVLDEERGPIRIDPEAGTVKIGADGSIRQGATTVAKLALVSAKEPQTVRKVGENLFDAGDTEMASAKVRVVPETVERSNFDVVKGMAGMIEGARAYELNARLLTLQDEATGMAVGRLARVA